MKTTIAKSLALFVFSVSITLAQEQNPSDGEVRQSAASPQAAWDSVGKEWVSLSTFWERYAARRGGLTWGKRTDYPPYGDVKEFDTMVIELDSGACMMMFFHTRWRRANDVRRWDDAFNAYSACPYVFD